LENKEETFDSLVEAAKLAGQLTYLTCKETAEVLESFKNVAELSHE
jgi:hypothetical protein